MLYKITPFVFNLPSDVLLHYISCSPGFTPLLFHLLLPLALSRLSAPLYPVTHHTRARWTLSSLSHCCYRSHLIPFMIFIFPIVTSLLLLYLFKVEKESKAYNQAALCSRCRSRVNFYKASFPIAFWRQSDWKKVPTGGSLASLRHPRAEHSGEENSPNLPCSNTEHQHLLLTALRHQTSS